MIYYNINHPFSFLDNKPTQTTQYFGKYLTSLISGVLSTGLCTPAGVPNE